MIGKEKERGLIQLTIDLKTDSTQRGWMLPSTVSEVDKGALQEKFNIHEPQILGFQRSIESLEKEIIEFCSHLQKIEFSPEYAKELAFGNQLLEIENEKAFNENCFELNKERQKLYDKIVAEWNALKSEHTNLLVESERIKTAIASGSVPYRALTSVNQNLYSPPVKEFYSPTLTEKFWGF